MTDRITIRPATSADHAAIWSILEPVFRAGDTYAIERDISEADALAFWFGDGNRVYVAEQGRILGTYFLRPNKRGGGGHVANAAFATAAEAQGKGVARTMLDHALEQAKAQGYRAMQFNFVVATNTRAIATWEKAGFATVGRLPGAFRHPEKGLVDALVMLKSLV